MANQRLELTWIGGRICGRTAYPALSFHGLWHPNAENMLIHGDNLLALKALEQ